MNPDSESKTLENESSEEEIVTEKISWAEGAEACSTLLKFDKRRPCYYIYCTAFRSSAETKRIYQNSSARFSRKTHTDLQSYPEQQR